MNFKPFDFSKEVDILELYQRLCFYHNEAFNSLNNLKENEKSSFRKFKELYGMLRIEDHEYSKVSNQKYIMFKPIISQYVKNIGDAYAKPTKVNSYENLSSNLYDVQDYMKYGFENIFCMKEKDNFVHSKLDNYFGHICVVEMRNFNVYVGRIDLKLFDVPSEKTESVSVLFLNEWILLNVDEIIKIKVLDM